MAFMLTNSVEYNNGITNINNNINFYGTLDINPKMGGSNQTPQNAIFGKFNTQTGQVFIDSKSDNSTK